MSVARPLDRMHEAFVSDMSVTRAVNAGRLRKLASRLYSRNMVDPPEAVVARRRGRPCDPDRLALFQVLHAALRDHPPLSRMATDRRPEGEATPAFFEAYFSNFIEGTEFAVDEAADIVFRGAVPNGGSHIPAAQGELIGVAGAGADEMHCHASLSGQPLGPEE